MYVYILFLLFPIYPPTIHHYFYFLFYCVTFFFFFFLFLFSTRISFSSPDIWLSRPKIKRKQDEIKKKKAIKPSEFPRHVMSTLPLASLLIVRIKSSDPSNCNVKITIFSRSCSLYISRNSRQQFHHFLHKESTHMYIHINISKISFHFRSVWTISRKLILLSLI